MKYALSIDTIGTTYYNDLTQEEAKSIFSKLKKRYKNKHILMQMLVYKDNKWVGFLQN